MPRYSKNKNLEVVSEFEKSEGVNFERFVFHLLIEELQKTKPSAPLVKVFFDFLFAEDEEEEDVVESATEKIKAVVLKYDPEYSEGDK